MDDDNALEFSMGRVGDFKVGKSSFLNANPSGLGSMGYGKTVVVPKDAQAFLRAAFSALVLSVKPGDEDSGGVTEPTGSSGE